MYKDFVVDIPGDINGITKKTIKGKRYVYYIHGRKYNPKRQNSDVYAVCIGKCLETDENKMYPNENYEVYLPECAIEAMSKAEEDEGNKRSACLRIGAYSVIKKIAHDYKLDEMAERIIGEDSGLFLDLAAYSLIEENNAGQYYPDYAFSHPLFTDDMRIYSDSKVSDFLNEVTVDQRIRFLDDWNKGRDHREKIYVSYDSSNKHCQAGDISLAEPGHEKDKQGKPVINYAIAYDRNNREPLFYEDYPGSIVDVSQLQYMIEKAKGYGYQRIGFILDRGYFSKGNIQYMDKNGYDFIIMVKGMKELMKDIVLRNNGRFEKDRRFSIRSYKVSGMTIRGRLYEGDEKERYIHIYYSEKKAAAEREQFEQKMDKIAKYLKEQEGKKVRISKELEEYFDIIYYHEGQEDECFFQARERTDVINKGIKLCGYFVIISSAHMDAGEALELYKSRDGSEKLFRGDKSYLGNKSLRVQSDESADTKIFVEFVGLTIRNRIYTYLTDEMKKDQKKLNYMTVPAAIKELEKIEMIRLANGEYKLDHAITATQKAILKAFGMSENDIAREAKAIGKTLRNSGKKKVA